MAGPQKPQLTLHGWFRQWAMKHTVRDVEDGELLNPDEVAKSLLELTRDYVLTSQRTEATGDTVASSSTGEHSVRVRSGS